MAGGFLGLTATTWLRVVVAANAAIYSPFAAVFDEAAKIRQLLQGRLPDF